MIKKNIYYLLLFIIAYSLGALSWHCNIFPVNQIKKSNTASKFNRVTKLEKPRYSLFELFAPESDYVMLGDSITEGGLWSEFFPDVKIANRGVWGDTTGDILSRMDSVYLLKPKKVFIMAGFNDLNQYHNIDDILSNYKNIIELLKQKRIEVVIQSTFECNINSCGDNLGKIRALNSKLVELSNSMNNLYLDINEGITTKKNGLLPEYTYDGVHLTALGYKQWAEKLRPLIIRIDDKSQ